jgi:hypothetical protein
MKRALAAVVAVFALGGCASICATRAGMDEAQLPGTWHAQVEGAPAVTLALSTHPEFAGTVRGWLERDGRRVAVAGDVDDGELTLEESADGVHISAAWLGDVVEGSCGNEIRGTWKAEGAAGERAFVMKKQR